MAGMKRNEETLNINWPAAPFKHVLQRRQPDISNNKYMWRCGVSLKLAPNPANLLWRRNQPCNGVAGMPDDNNGGVASHYQQ